MPERKPVTPESLLQLQFVDAVALSPDGTRVVYQVRTIDPEEDGYQSHLWLVPLAGGSPAASRSESTRTEAPSGTRTGNRSRSSRTGARRRRRSIDSRWKAGKPSG